MKNELKRSGTLSNENINLPFPLSGKVFHPLLWGVVTGVEITITHEVRHRTERFSDCFRLL